MPPVSSCHPGQPKLTTCSWACRLRLRLRHEWPRQLRNDNDACRHETSRNRRRAGAGEVGMIAMTPESGLLIRGRIFALAAVICLWGVQAVAADGLTTLRSSFGPKATMDRLEAEVKAKGMTVFARIDHAAGATEVGLPLRP